ncbi:MAG: Na+-dependent transporter [Alphaproteobacteria bacterium]
MITAPLAWLGRQGPRAIAAVVVIAIATPTLGAMLKPFVTEAIFALLCIAFLRVDSDALRGYLRRPALVLGATMWTTLAVPLLFGVIGMSIGLDTRAPALFLALMLQAAASPMMAAPAFAAIMGLDATLVLTTLVASTALTPLTAPLFLHLFIGPALSLSPLALGLKLSGLLAGSMILAVVIRRVAGAAAIARYSDQVNGLNILLVFVFVAAVMENVGARFLAAPVAMLALLATAFAIAFALLGVTALVLARSGRARAFALGMMTSQRNMGLMLAAAGNVLPDATWLYFALAQFPIYLSPLILGEIARRWTKPSKAPDQSFGGTNM